MLSGQARKRTGKKVQKDDTPVDEQEQEEIIEGLREAALVSNITTRTLLIVLVGLSTLVHIIHFSPLMSSTPPSLFLLIQTIFPLLISLISIPLSTSYTFQLGNLAAAFFPAVSKQLFTHESVSLWDFLTPILVGIVWRANIWMSEILKNVEEMEGKKYKLKGA
ncbi:hypothetical protein [Phaffia rhodozyma]|uniref:Uncharacterized protein n=1 Tax=Phaffia rhodozyma TaxID=264483 RepID=A0A0F7SPL1_PHARH|nr:hypothetical protein [Phaffia rhodozyma]